MRSFQKSWIGIALAIIFGVSLFFFKGSQRYSNLFNSDNFVAYISGTPISTTKFMRSMDIHIRQFAQMLGTELNGDQIRNFQVHQIALQNLVNSAIFENEFDNINFILDDLTIAKQTRRNFPYLYTNNKLNDEALNSFLSQQGLKIEDLVDLVDFETRSRIFDKLFFEKNYPEQLQVNLNKHENQIREIDLIKISYEDIKLDDYKTDQITKDNQELINFFNDNISNYMTKEERDISYIIIKKNDFKDSFLPSDSRIIDYYENNKELFFNLEQRSFKQFNFKSKDEADNFKLIISGKSNDDIIEYANKNDILFNVFENVEKNRVLEELANVIFQLSEGDISEVVDTTLASHIIILDEIIPERQLPFEDVKYDIKNTLTNIELDNFFNELKISINQQILNGYKIDEIASQNDLRVSEINKTVNNNQFDENLLNNITSFSFNQNKDFVSDVVDYDENISFIVNVNNVYPSKKENIDDVFKTVLNDFIFAKKTDQAKNIHDNNLDNFSNIIKLYNEKEENIKISLSDENEIPFSFKQILFETDINQIAFGSDETNIYFAKIKTIEMPNEGQNFSKINLVNDLKTAFGSEIIKTKEISFNDELINGLLSQYK